MKTTIDYAAQDLQMGDLLREHGVSRESLDPVFLTKLRADLEQYMSSNSTEFWKIEFPGFMLQIRGCDEAGYLYTHLS